VRSFQLMVMTQKKSPPPLKFVLVLVSTIFASIALGVTFLFSLPWFFLKSEIWIIFSGLILLGVGFPLMYLTSRTLSVYRALGKEIYQDRTQSQLVTTGIYSYTRNPLYLSSSILFLGWTLLTRFTPLIIITLLFMILFVRVAKWEEKELAERFGQEYLEYKNRVPFIVPYPRRQHEPEKL
jgi:protein-S-isoprenylcysteine O-methyltransferase Ste14